MGQLLRFGKMTFTLAQGILGSFPFGYVHGCADEFNDLARGIHHRVRDGVKVLYFPVRKNDSNISIRVSPSRLWETHFLSLIKACSVVGVNSIANKGPSGLQFRVELMNAKELFRPEVLVSTDVNRPTARVGEPLRFGKVCLPALQLLGQQFLLGDIDRGTEKPLEDFAVNNGNSDAANVAQLAVGANNS